MHAIQLVSNFPCNYVMQVFIAQAEPLLEGQQISPTAQFMEHLHKVAKCVNLANTVPLGLIQIIPADKANIVRIMQLPQVVGYVRVAMFVESGKTSKIRFRNCVVLDTTALLAQLR